MNPQLDHWFPQSKYPLLQVSFYNLIPSCEICNSRVKNSTIFNLTDHFHPYVSSEEKITFDYFPTGTAEEYRIFFTKDSGKKIKLTSEKMFVDEMYNAHIPELKDILLIEQAYSKSYLQSLRTAFPGAKLQDSEIYRLAFGTEMRKEDFHKRPMSKFKHDILKKLGVI